MVLLITNLTNKVKVLNYCLSGIFYNGIYCQGYFTCYIPLNFIGTYTNMKLNILALEKNEGKSFF